MTLLFRFWRNLVSQSCPERGFWRDFWEMKGGLQEQGDVDAREKEVVAEVTEVGDAAFRAFRVADGNRDVDARGAGPGESDTGDGFEIKGAAGAGFFECGEGGGDGVEPEAAERISGTAAEGFEVCEEISGSAAEDAAAGGVGSESGDSADERVRGFFRSSHERADHFGRVLAIGVHHQGVGESRGLRGGESVEDGGALAGIFFEAEEADAGNSCGFLGAAIGAAIDDRPNIRPLGLGLAEGLGEAGTAVVAGQQDEAFQIARTAGKPAARGVSNLRKKQTARVAIAAPAPVCVLERGSDLPQPDW